MVAKAVISAPEEQRQEEHNKFTAQLYSKFPTIVKLSNEIDRSGFSRVTELNGMSLYIDKV